MRAANAIHFIPGVKETGKYWRYLINRQPSQVGVLLNKGLNTSARAPNQCSRQTQNYECFRIS